ncbi:hypothetical protein OIT41_18175 [Arthrobacter sp. YA7-1]|uniref:hypothetical protein n=1 Tax=Arthrobacter sp. YA7-1 TaxID=2987701 RepID=UPI0022277C42|nr:hypothetical protein [Arthrobacter sp. YA7-1]UYY81202.1 hypothetical protein OIT41_18175 [Arthrobacter sp. YA7-1]
MKKMLAPLGILFAAVLALTGCGGPSNPGTAAASSSTPTPTPTPTPKTYTNEELASIVAQLKDDQGKPLTVIPAAQIDQGIIAAKQMLKSAVITPPACAALANNNAQVPEGATYAAGQSISAADKSVTVITALAVKDPTVLGGQTKKSSDALAQCSTFTIEAGGQKVTTRTQSLPEKTSGDQSVGMLMTQVLASGQKATTLTVTGVKGNLGATAIKTGATVTPDSAAELVKLVDAVLGQ